MSNIVTKINSELKEAYKSRIAAANQAQSLKIISSDIYTEAERFIFELIQNAVDSYVDTAEESLDIRMELRDGYLVFMHNGKAFSERDVEGICGIGNGSKGNDSKKIGYKGIGFKSVFVHSNDVVIASGEHCFRFSESEWDNYEHKMPWQIIPILATSPISINECGNYNVITYIKLKDADSIPDTISTLLSDSQFLLFLQCKNAVITFINNNDCIVLRKKCTEDIIELSRDNKIETRWLTHSIDECDAVIPAEVKNKILLDEKTPNKIKDSLYFDLSFAIKLNEDGEIETVPSDESVYFSYLPTSVKSGFKFLVNANLITDAGRQQIHKECEWNKFIVSQIPGALLKWISSISRKYPNYYKILPGEKKGSDKLESIFNDALEKSLQEIAFIPSVTSDNMLKVSAALIDRLSIVNLYDEDVIVDHINRKYNKTFSCDSYIANQGIGIFKEYGVFVFDASHIQALISDEDINTVPSSDFSFKLIEFLYEHVNDIPDKAQRESFINELRSIDLIYCSDTTMQAPKNVFFKNGNFGIIEPAKVMNYSLYSKLSSKTLQWLETIGVSHMTPKTYFDKVLSRVEITQDNAISIVRFAFRSYTKGEIPIDALKQSWWLKYISKNKTIVSLDQLYLGTFYSPHVDIEPYVDSDIFISEDYVDTSDSIEEWKSFFIKLGIQNSLNICDRKYSDGDIFNILSRYRTQLERTSWESYNGCSYSFHLDYFELSYFPLVNLTENRHQLAKLVFSDVFSRSVPSTLSVYARGASGIVPRTLTLMVDSYLGNRTSFIDEALNDHQLLPSTDGKMLLAKNLFKNTPANVEIGGKYLPIIDIDCEIHYTWDRYLNFKSCLHLDDYLTILSGVANDAKVDNKERILLVYEKILSDCQLSNPENHVKIRNWAENNKLVAIDGKYYDIKDLAHVSIPGFEESRQIYVGGFSEAQITTLLNAFGVNILTEDSISFEIIGEQVVDSYLHSRIVERLPYIALLKLASDGTYANFTECYNEIKTLAEKFDFVNCAGISLSHSNFKKTVQTFSRGGKFYYAGNLNIAKLEAIFHSLACELGIQNRQKELFVILLDQLEDVENYCKDRGYDIKVLEELSAGLKVDTGGDMMGVGFDSGIDLMKRYEYSEEAKKLVQKRLESEGFEFTKGLGSFSVINGVMKNGVEYPLVVKSCRSWDNTTTINPAEWEALFKRNSMLWIHFGQGHIEPINAHEIFAYNDQFTLSFSTINLQDQKKVNAILSVMRYLNGVKLDLRCIAPSEPRGRNLDEYLFNVNRTIDDLNSVDQSIL